eukprot:scaffold16101_cov28-Attheya_sp.AAC.2
MAWNWLGSWMAGSWLEWCWIPQGDCGGDSNCVVNIDTHCPPGTRQVVRRSCYFSKFDTKRATVRGYPTTNHDR